MKIYLFFLLIVVTLATTVVNGMPEQDKDEALDNLLKSIFEEKPKRQRLEETDEYIMDIFKSPDPSTQKIVTTNESESQMINKSITNGVEQFSDNLYKTASEDQHNVALSPLSVYAALSIIASGARWATRGEMINVLHLPADFQDAASNYRNLMNGLKSSEDMTVRLLNKVFINKQFQVRREFQSSLNDYFNASVEQFDSHDSGKTTEIANSWVSKETNEQIKDLFNPSHFADASMIVANVLYFKGHWKNIFVHAYTENREFHGINGNHLVPMMTQEDNFKYGVLPEINATFIELPYVGDDYSMIVILPDKSDGLKEVEKKLETVTLESIRERGSISYIKVFLPKFRVETTIEMKALLQKMGLKRMFTNSADFSGISDSLSTVSDVVQKVFIDVNEAGTEAGAATYAKMVSYMLRYTSATFNADHPFHFKIIKTIGDNDGITLFAGSIKSL